MNLLNMCINFKKFNKINKYKFKCGFFLKIVNLIFLIIISFNTSFTNYVCKYSLVHYIKKKLDTSSLYICSYQKTSFTNAHVTNDVFYLMFSFIIS